jgi:hypothetical protein
MHLDDSTLDLYLTRVLDRDELRSFDRHVMTCLPCLLLLESAGLDPDRWERRGLLGRLARVAAPVIPPAVERRQAA